MKKSTGNVTNLHGRGRVSMLSKCTAIVQVAKDSSRIPAVELQKVVESCG